MIANIQVETDFWFARPLSNNTGWTWTLASRLGHILCIAEDLFGPRDHTYTILGVEFGGEIPQIWFPGNCRNIVIQITPACATDVSRACYQMAHEVIHLLSPTGGQNANNFEEGLATYFSQYYMRTQFGQLNWNSNVESYRRALNLIAPHLDGAHNAVRRMRISQPAISSISSQELLAEFHNLTEDDANFLVQPLDRGT